MQAAREIEPIQKHYIVASELPSGISWLLNILLELSIKVHRSDAEEFWTQSNNGFVLAEMHEEVKRWLPCFSTERVFQFPEPVSFQWTHEWPREDICSRPVLFFNRCGLDSAYSEYRRNHPDLSFSTFLRSPFRVTPAIFPTLLHVYPADMWAMYCLLWRRLAHPDSHWVRFEDMRLDASEGMHKILLAFGFTRSVADLEWAIENSTVQRAKAAEDAYLSQHPEIRTRMNRGGKVGEWRQTFGQRELMSFTGLPAQALEAFGYAAESQSVRNLEQRSVAPSNTLIRWAAEQRNSPSLALPYLVSKVTKSEQALDLARWLTAYQWSEDLHNQTFSSSAFKNRMRAELVELVAQLELRPLTLVAFAKSLGRDHPAAALKMLTAYLDPRDLSFFEALQLGRCFEGLGDRVSARRFFSIAGQSIEGSNGPRLYAWHLMEEGMYQGAWSLLKASRTMGWTGLALRQWLKRIRSL